MKPDNKILDDLAEKIAAGLQVLGGLKQGAEAQVRSIVESAIDQFDVVTHERMQVQEAMLSKAREDLKALEARVIELEHKLSHHKEK